MLHLHDFDCDHTRISTLAAMRRPNWAGLEIELPTHGKYSGLHPRIETILKPEGAQDIIRRPRRWSLPILEQSKAFSAAIIVLKTILHAMLR